jgi:phosphoheptose isomerase
MPEANRIRCDGAQMLLSEELAGHRLAFEATATMLDNPFLETLEIVESGLRRGGKLLLFGNGGSAADAQHIAAELIVRYKTDRAAISAIALTTDSSALTACGNDFGFDTIFERQIAGLGRLNDVACGISTSGLSANVLRGLRQARDGIGHRRHDGWTRRGYARVLRCANRGAFDRDSAHPGNAHHDRSYAV